MSKERPSILVPEDEEQIMELLKLAMQSPIERRPISKGEFMHAAGQRSAFHLQEFLDTERTRRAVQDLEDNDYRVNFYTNGQGNVSYEAKPKGEAGFKRYRDEERKTKRTR